MSAVDLEQPITAGGIQSSYFFNGRLLSGEDLTHEQAMNLLGLKRVGEAIGRGIVCGLEVQKNSTAGTTASPVLTIKSGLAVNGEGGTLYLKDDTDVSLIRRNSETSLEKGVFNPCVPVQPGVYVAGQGVYLLTLAPAEKKEGRAQVSGLGNAPSNCNTKYVTAAVQFRLVQLLSGVALGPAAAIRNQVAYLCFGFPDPLLTTHLSNPVLNPLLKYGTLDSLSSSILSRCEVPLAVLYWTAAGGVEFVDLWSVRRRVTHPDASALFDYFVCDRRSAEGEAMLFQFQAHIAEIRAQTGVPPTLAATSRFKFLPPAGVLPVGTGNFTWSTFLGVHAPTVQVPIDSSQVRPLLWRSMGQEPVPVGAANPIKFNVFSVGSSHVVFSRSSLNESVASDVFFNNSFCQLDGANTVQKAIDELCKRYRGCCTFVVTPEPGWESVFTKIPTDHDAQICFQAGTYPVTTPVQVAQKGHLHIHGAGDATRFLSNQSEAIFIFDRCRSVTLKDVALESSFAAASGLSGEHLNGTATFVRCASVTVDSVTATCAASARRAGSCIAVRNNPPSASQKPTSSAAIRNCEFFPGSNQVGALLVNVGLTTIEDNVVRGVPHSGFGNGPASQGFVVAGSIAREVRVVRNTIETVLQGIHLGLSQGGDPAGTFRRIEKALISRNSVHVRLESRRASDRHGIFVGNCSSAIVESNWIDVERAEGAERVPIEGIKIFGDLGRSMIVRHNDISGCTFGIHFESLAVPSGKRHQWIITDNLMRGASTPVSSPEPTRSFIRGISDNIA